ncbi:nicotinate (nicotinamide) nucleotide adenylyltransferase [Clostridiaceae bacterium DONG20-135]|uniref:Probable nicotinate-nucleotide adenylyltransferase n=1 Tax=Copranaerobaculum intestinale TaxID=2692629 RepID=A0A6N8U7U0_9FIRM|nr:nicotinate (nicotinamide) nucleotide adenylyltransferase [Copranaerobaculum intestinale]MXQ73900.1 nicotinate (nicotinamide) nucleotide adenylyltransferase [Copranaerobaculum intestinale]
MRIAILGGSFDPIHKAHLQIAKCARKQFADEVWFMPTAQTPLKNRSLSENHHRAAMIRLAIAPYRHMRLSTLELERGGASYTIDTVQELIRRYPQHTFYWLIGSDQEAQLAQWKDIETLARLVSICVYPRGDQTNITKHDFPIQQMTMKPMPISSTMARSNELSILPYSVRRYIGEHGLYMDEIVSHTMSEKRFSHSKRVAELCVELAAVHGLDTRQAYLAGILHDVCKEWPYEKARIWMRHMEPQWLNSAPAIWHGFIASRYVKRYYQINDREITYAIRWHVLGSDSTKLAMILFAADKLERGRGYDSSREIELCKHNLRLGYQEVKRQQQAYIEQEHKKEIAVHE